MNFLLPLYHFISSERRVNIPKYRARGIKHLISFDKMMYYRINCYQLVISLTLKENKKSTKLWYPKSIAHSVNKIRGSSQRRGNIELWLV